MLGGGLRRQEVAELTLSQFNRNNQTLRILGKGNKEREVPVESATTPAVFNGSMSSGDWSRAPSFARFEKVGVSSLVT